MLISNSMQYEKSHSLFSVNITYIIYEIKITYSILLSYLQQFSHHTVDISI